MMLILHQKQQDFNMCDFGAEIKNISRSGWQGCRTVAWIKAKSDHMTDLISLLSY